MIVHIDCNSFYASVEVAEHPELIGKPVVVANDNEAGGGIILALTKEAKKLGLKRGNPVFKVRRIFEANGVAMFHADLRKYGRVSELIMRLVEEQGFVEEFTRYSIDEFFGRIPESDPEQMRVFVSQVVDEIMRKSGIPVSCGCADTYTLAKTATWFAKHYEGYQGICVITAENREKALRKIGIENVWGIGRAIGPKLKSYGLRTAYDFTMQSESLVKALMTITGVRTWKELRGEPAISLSEQPHQRTIMHSRTFAFMETEISKLKEFLSNYVSDAAVNLRKEHCMCRSVTVFIRTNPHRADLPQYSAEDTVKLVTPTANTQELLRNAFNVLERIFCQGYKYKRMGVIFGGIIEDSSVQLELFDKTNSAKNRRLMEVADKLNSQYGHNTVRLSIQGDVKTRKDKYEKGK